MSKKMTPCEKLGYKVGDKFTVIKDSYFGKGTIVALSEDDGSEVPWFTCGGVRRALIIGSNPDVEPTPSKLKPAKQALADAINQNGGWRSGANWACQHGLNRMVVFSASGLAPTRNAARGMACWDSGAIFFDGFQFDRKLPDWHQCVLSRDEYFTAYPEQVNVEVSNETKHKVEAEMKSESEVAIKASDWHKNGELPPVGEVCEFVRTGDVHWHKQLNTGAEVKILAHYSPCDDGEMVAVFCHKVCNETEEGRLVDQGMGVCFRPLRTEREKAIDEMMEHCDYLGSRDFAVKLFDAGYRKEVK